MESKYFDRHGHILRCQKCHAPFLWDTLTNDIHDDDLCIGRQLAQAKKEIQKLKASVDAWKDAYRQLRDIIGWLWWHHPAIASDESRQYYQHNLKVLKEKKQHEHQYNE